MSSFENNIQASVEQCGTKLKDLILQSQRIYLSQNKKNYFLERVFDQLQQTGYDETFFKVAQQHAKVMETVILRNKKDYDDLEFVSPEECLSYYIAKVFFDKIVFYRSLCNPVNINYAAPMKILPILAFLKEDEKARLKFEKTLMQYDVLYVEVLKTTPLQPPSDENAELYELRIICRVNLNDTTNNEFVYHLNSRAFMFKKLEMLRLGRTEFSASEVLKVSVIGRAKLSARTFVTTNNSALKIPIPSSIKSSIVLGPVSSENVPFDLNSFKISCSFEGYANYLRSHSAFYHSLNLKDEIASIGIDPYRIYSFHPLRDGMTLQPNETAASLYDSAMVATHAESPVHLVKAKKFLEKDDYKSAIQAFEDSLKCWPENYQVYEIRGKMYLGMCEKKLRRGSFLRNAVKDFETALELNSSAHEPKKCLSEIFVYLSKRLVKNKEFDSAKKLVQHALKLFPENKEAGTMMRKIDKKASYYVGMEEDLDLTTLQMRKKLLEKQLKKEIKA